MNNLKCLKQGFNKYVCKYNNKVIELSKCKNCPYKEYKDINQYKLKNKTSLKQRSSKLAKLERNRFSLFTDDLDHCIICGKKKDNIHEVFFGRNRLNSMKFGLTIPLCNYHHQMIHSNPVLSNEYKKRGQALFDRAYPDMEFIKVFGRNYIISDKS